MWFAAVFLVGCTDAPSSQGDARAELDAFTGRDSSAQAPADAAVNDSTLADATIDAAPSCQGIAPIGGLTRQTSFRISRFQQGNAGFPDGPITVTTFAPFFGERWPARTQNRTLAVGIGRFIALEFNTGTVSVATYGERPTGSGMPNRYGSFEWVPPSEAGGRPLVVISECPGDFVNLPENNTHCRNTAGGFSRLAWVVGVPTEALACRLRENTRYYLNVAFVDYDMPSMTSCDGTGTPSNPNSCHWFVQPR